MTTNNLLNSTTTGVQSLTTSGTLSGVTLTGTANQVGATNADGTAGNPTLALTSNIYVSGISFNSGTNTLSTFSEGTWTPGISSTGTPPTVTYTTQIGRYSKIGNAVFLQAYVVLSSNSGGTSQARFTSLPFTSAAVNNQFFAFDLALQNCTFTASVVMFFGSTQNNTTTAEIAGTKAATTNAAYAITNLSSTAILNLSGWYSTA